MFENNMPENIEAMKHKSLRNPDNPWNNLVTPAFKQFLNELAGNDTTTEK